MTPSIDGLGERIRFARTAAGLAQDDLAREVGVRALAISEAERGVVVPRTQTLAAIAKRLGCSLDWLVSGEGSPPGSQPAVSPV